jgi:hypothetical protein
MKALIPLGESLSNLFGLLFGPLSVLLSVLISVLLPGLLPEDRNSSVIPQRPAATDPGVHDTLPPAIKIYNLVAIKMTTGMVDKGGP